MKTYLEYVDDVLEEFDGQLSYTDIFHMTYKEIGYMMAHRKKHHPKAAKDLSAGLMGMAPRR